MKVAGIVADNYKVERFKKELANAGFEIEKIVPFTGDTSTIKVFFADNSQQKEIQKICNKVELRFKRSN